jgi:hypothetical protein
MTLIVLSYSQVAILTLGYILGLFSFELITAEHRWDVALERSFFQVLAVVGILLQGWITRAQRSPR